VKFFELLPGVRETLAALAAHPRYESALVTGNIKPMAELKMELVGLDHFFTLPGAFGDESHNRRDLPARAAARAASLATGSHVFHRVHDRRSCGGLEVARTAAPILIETPFAPAQLPTAISQLPNIGGGPANTRRVQGSHSIAIITRPAPVTHQEDRSSMRMKRPPSALPETRIHREPGPGNIFRPS